eukprot:6195082-Pleurochrysis_carterae.AAC.1
MGERAGCRQHGGRETEKKYECHCHGDEDTKRLRCAHALSGSRTVPKHSYAPSTRVCACLGKGAPLRGRKLGLVASLGKGERSSGGARVGRGDGPGRERDAEARVVRRRAAQLQNQIAPGHG